MDWPLWWSSSTESHHARKNWREQKALKTQDQMDWPLDDACLQKVIMQGQVEGSRKPRTPRTRWIDHLMKLVYRKSSCKAKLKGVECLEDPGPDGLTTYKIWEEVYFESQIQDQVLFQIFILLPRIIRDVLPLLTSSAVRHDMIWLNQPITTLANGALQYWQNSFLLLQGEKNKNINNLKSEVYLVYSRMKLCLVFIPFILTN